MVVVRARNPFMTVVRNTLGYRMLSKPLREYVIHKIQERMIYEFITRYYMGETKADESRNITQATVF